MSAEHSLSALFPGLTVLGLQAEADHLTLTARSSAPTVPCPSCAVPSTRVHSYYTRQPQDLPLLGASVRLLLHVRRWRCRNPACARKTFSDPLPGLLAPAAQRTLRLNTTLQQLGLALGGEAGARQSQRQAMPASPDTLLRRTRQLPLPPRPTPRVLAVDDFAFRKGRTYGTLLVDGETHRPVDLLAERSAASLATWLQKHPGVEIITRDRAAEYACGATEGAPQARQVLDRWHLIRNLHEALVRLLNRLRTRLEKLVPPAPGTVGSATDPTPLSIYDRDKRRGTQDQVKQQASRARRYALFAQVKALAAQGRNILQIARDLAISRQTVRHYLASEQFPEYSAHPRQPSILDPHVAWLQERWEAGCRTNKELYAGLVAQGYQGSIRPLVQWTRLRRDHAAGGQRRYGRREARPVEVFVAAQTRPPQPTRTPQLPGAQVLAWLLLAEEDRLGPDKKQLREHLKQEAEVSQAIELAQQFLHLVRQRRPDDLAAWLAACGSSGVREVTSFAAGLQREEVYVRGALESPYSNGVAEGNVTRLKQIRRAMYGRGNFDLLKIRVLVAA